MLPESPEMFDSEEYDDLYSLVYYLGQEGFTFEQILEAMSPRMQYQTQQLQAKGYLGGDKNNTSGI